MIHDRSFSGKGDAEELKKIAEEYKRFYAHQHAVDEKQLAMLLFLEVLSSPVQPGQKPVKFQSSIGGTIWRENASLFAPQPTVVVNAPEDDPDLLDHANQKLEPWLNAAINRSQEVERIFIRKAPDMLAIGRAWDFFAPRPGKWVNPEIKGIISKLESETDEKTRKELKKDLANIRRDNWPFTYRYVDPRGAMFMPGGDVRLPLVIESRRMTHSQIRMEYGENTCTCQGDGEHEIYPYANHFESGILVCCKTDKIVKQFEHGLKMSPYGLMEAKLLPANDKNIRWGGMLYHALDLIPGFDQLLTDYMTYVHNYTFSAVGIFHDKDTYEEDPKAAGRPTPMTIEPGKTYDFWDNEKVMPLFTAQMNDQQNLILQKLQELIYQNFVSAPERGEFKSGQSNNLGVTALQQVQRKAEPYMTAIEDDHRSLAIRHMRGVCALNEGYDTPDPVEIMDSVSGKNSYIGLVPKDTYGWEAAIQSVMSRANLVDRQQLANLSETLVRLGVAREQVLEEQLGYSQPDRVIERGWQSQMDQGLFEVDMAAVINLSGQKWAMLTPQEQQRMAELESQASPEVAGAAMTAFPETPGPEMQARSNERRSGSFQQPQQPTATAV